MEYALKERIGNPELFIGRKKELEYYLNWINGIKQEKSKSTAILARRKMGKTALMERLFNITYYRNDGVIPFYYEIKEIDIWVKDFCKEFFMTFIFQYIAFKSRKIEYLRLETQSNFNTVLKIAQSEGLDYLCDMIENFAHAFENEEIGILWNIAREAPKTIASRQNEFIVQMIDEFQFLGSKIYMDKELKNLHVNIAGGYLSTAESKIAPLLVSGSWVDWLRKFLIELLPARFKYKPLPNMPEDESIEMVYKYSQFFEVPVTDETAYLISQIAEGSPFYISAIMRSECEEKDLTTIEGLTKTLEFETLSNQGEIKATWMEYISSALPRINDRYGKSILLYLCKNREREVTRKEIMDDLKLDMTDTELELKLKAMVKSDIIKQGHTNFDYQGVQDNIFDKVFRGVYEKEIQHFDIKTIGKEYSEKLSELRKQFNRLQGEFNFYKGYYAEYALYDQLRLHAKNNNEFFKSITRYLPEDFNFTTYSYVWKYNYAPIYSKSFNIDIFARAVNKSDYSIIGEVKNRNSKKFDKEEALNFFAKFEEIRHIEKLERALGFIFSLSGFTEDAELFCKEKGIACSHDERWLGVK